jgi:hypothetical protein
VFSVVHGRRRNNADETPTADGALNAA